ncbi:MAG: SusD/RagB family nutrient-binding outer membrane lipoprotein [Pseudobacter sp.]|uniref:SusD/RagB family nutrient-binding outer membrane lipoprotein n=1 Tax=Pseudobacter sp. TaxID=2045420 RepID=UPI003F805FF5
MKKIILSIAVMAALASCTKNLTDLNIDPKNPPDASAEALFTNAERRLSNNLVSASTNQNIFRLIIQHYQQTQYVDESNFDLGTRSISDNSWDAMYRNVLADLQASIRLVERDEKNADVKKNKLAFIDILQVYTYYYIVSTYGNVPYTDALNIEITFPRFDDGKTIYNHLLTRLDASIAALNPAAGSFTTADVIYDGNIARWKKFANSIKLKMALTIADDDEDKAQLAAEQAVASGVFTSNNDNAMFPYITSPPNTNPIWVDLVQSQRDDFVPCQTLVAAMNDLDDPRRNDFFTLDPNGGYSGGDPGIGTSFGSKSHVQTTITAADFPGDLLDYSEVEFLLAEAVERGFNVGGTAEEHYNKAITASILFWKGTVAEANTYLAKAEVDYETAGGTWREKIGLQKWIALYNRGWDSWIEWRKFDFPVLVPGPDAQSDIPVRYPYPVNEQNVNTKNWEQASAAIGGDEVSTKLWWDKN